MRPDAAMRLNSEEHRRSSRSNRGHRGGQSERKTTLDSYAAKENPSGAGYGKWRGGSRLEADRIDLILHAPVPPERVAIGPGPDRRYFAKPVANGSRSRTVPE
jgi:hypothetical protein